MHNFMVCSQNMYHYTQLPSEPELTKPNDSQLLQNSDGTWPTKGVIEFKDVGMRYRETMEPSLRGLSFVAQSGMKVGVVGRTGAGKSSILQTLFRLSDAHQGQITVDGTDIKEVGLHLLRRNIQYIP